MTPKKEADLFPDPLSESGFSPLKGGRFAGHTAGLHPRFFDMGDTTTPEEPAPAAAAPPAEPGRELRRNAGTASPVTGDWVKGFEARLRDISVEDFNRLRAVLDRVGGEISPGSPKMNAASAGATPAPTATARAPAAHAEPVVTTRLNEIYGEIKGEAVPLMFPSRTLPDGSPDWSDLEEC